MLRALDAAVNTAGGIAGNPDFHRRLTISVSWTFLALHHAFGTAALIFLSAQAKDVALTKFAPKVLRRAICTKRGFCRTCRGDNAHCNNLHVSLPHPRRRGNGACLAPPVTPDEEAH